MRNPFDSDPAARRYATARPYYHRSALDLAMGQQQIGPARLAIDVGCGTGLSARAVSDLADQPAFATWLTESYLPRYPSPIRHAQFDPEAAARAGFGRVSFCESDYRIPFTGAEMADYLLSQSNAAAAIESGTISAEALRNQIIGETAAFFRPDVRVIFGIRVWTAVRQPRPQAGGHSFATRVSTS